VTLPARYRDHFRDGVVLVRFPDGEPCISVFHPADWDRYDNKHVEPLDTFNDPAAAWRTRSIYSNQDLVEPDGQGRVLLGRHIEKVGLSGKVTIIGARTHLEIWDPATLADRQRKAETRDA
jgi:division/cell wall cluster transcriptional repressor MraZ